MAIRILIVDDSPAMRSFIRRTITLSGLAVEECYMAGNGVEALDLLRKHTVDLILSDINMPEMDGARFLEEVEKDPDMKKSPVIVVSTDSTHVRVNAMLALGARGYIKKPFPPEALKLRCNAPWRNCWNRRLPALWRSCVSWVSSDQPWSFPPARPACPAVSVFTDMPTESST